MKRRAEKRDEAVSIQVGFVLNTGLLTTFIAIVLVVISGGFGEDISTEEELEVVADSVEANMIEADRLTVTSDSFTAFFEPPESDLGYQAEIESGELVLTASKGVTTEVTRDLDSITRTNIDNDISFGPETENIIIEYEDSGTGNLEMSVQRDVVGG